MEEEIKETNSAKDELSLDLEFEISNDVKTLYANEVAIQTLHSEVILSFFEVRIPIRTVKSSEDKAIGLCVGRIAMPLGKVPAIIEALDSQFSKHLAKIDALEKSEGEIDDSNNDVKQ